MASPFSLCWWYFLSLKKIVFFLFFFLPFFTVSLPRDICIHVILPCHSYPQPHPKSVLDCGPATRGPQDVPLSSPLCGLLTLKALIRTASGKDGDRNTCWGWGHHESNAWRATDAQTVAVFIFYSAVVDEEEEENYMMLWKSISVWDDEWGCRLRLLSQSPQELEHLQRRSGN